MKRLLSKKGFSLVELIIVIAIIAILMAIVIPILSTSSSYEKEARENARAFYSNVQQATVQEKLNKTLKDKFKDKDYMLVYAVVEIPDDTTLAYSKVYVDFADKPVSGNYVTFSAKDIVEKNCIFEADKTSANQQSPGNIKNPSDETLKKLSEFGGTINKLLQTSEHSGYYYAVVDNKYRVVSAYYSIEADYEKLNGNNFSRDFRVKYDEVEYITGAYPYTLLDQGDSVFVDPDA